MLLPYAWSRYRPEELPFFWRRLDWRSKCGSLDLRPMTDLSITGLFIATSVKPKEIFPGNRVPNCIWRRGPSCRVLVGSYSRRWNWLKLGFSVAGINTVPADMSHVCFPNYLLIQGHKDYNGFNLTCAGKGPAHLSGVGWGNDTPLYSIMQLELEQMGVNHFWKNQDFMYIPTCLFSETKIYVVQPATLYKYEPITLPNPSASAQP